jgi:sortase A
MNNHNDKNHKDETEDPAVNLIRSRINSLYGNEPNAKIEIEEVEHTTKKLSKHQKFMHDLSQSGESLAEIQTKWHNYYLSLSDTEKREVWQEFYDANKKTNQPALNHKTVSTHKKEHPPQKTYIYKNDEVDLPPKHHKKQTIAELKERVTHSAKKHHSKKLSAKGHFKSLLFGLSMGLFTLVLLLFGFFNERFIAPFITPSKNISSTSIIIDPSSTKAGPNPTIIIPKINLEVPVVYDVGSIDEKAIQKGLEGGVVHYATTPNPGEKGNLVIVGHSSNNFFNQGKYKFAFVLLKKLEVGDTFSLTKNSKRYTYKVYDKKIVKPTDLAVLGKAEKPATATLITCDPPGTSLNRLVVLGEQITPEPSTNKASTAVASSTSQPQIVPGNAPSLWSRFTNWLTN